MTLTAGVSRAFSTVLVLAVLDFAQARVGTVVDRKELCRTHRWVFTACGGVIALTIGIVVNQDGVFGALLDHPTR